VATRGGVVTVPYEHATFERKLKELRYETGDPGDRLAMLHDIGVDMGRILARFRAFPAVWRSIPVRRIARSSSA
jgi:hypothetical protein